MSLVTHLCNNICFFCYLGKLAAFNDSLCHRFFEIYMLFSPHKCCSDRSVVVIGSSDYNCIDRWFFLEHLPPVGVDFGLGISLDDVSCIFKVYVAQCINICQLDNPSPLSVTHLDGCIRIGLPSCSAGSICCHPFLHFSHPCLPLCNLFLGHRCAVGIPCRAFNRHIRRTYLLYVAATLASNSDTSHIDRVTGGSIALAAHHRAWNNCKCGSSSGCPPEEIPP